jgi:glycosyltransferase involved in cell wall biosynthesis
MGDERDLSHKLSDIWKLHPQQSGMSQRCRETYMENYHPNAVYPSLLRVYENVVKTNRT